MPNLTSSSNKTTPTSAVELLNALKLKVEKALIAVDTQNSTLLKRQESLRSLRIQLSQVQREEQRIAEVEASEAALLAADAAAQAKLAEELAAKQAEEHAKTLEAITPADIGAVLAAAADAISASTEVIAAVAVSETTQEREKKDIIDIKEVTGISSTPPLLTNTVTVNTVTVTELTDKELKQPAETLPLVPKEPVIPETPWDRSFSVTPPAYVFSIYVQAPPPPPPPPSADTESKVGGGKTMETPPTPLPPKSFTVGVQKSSPLSGKSITLTRMSTARCLASFVRSGGVTAGLEADLADMTTEELIEVLHAADDFALNGLVDAIKTIILSEDEF